VADEAGVGGAEATMQDMHAKPTRAELKARIISLLREIASIESDQITEDATVDEQLQMHSVAFVELQVAIEEEYQIQIDPIHLVELNRFGDIIDYIHSSILNESP
jgi:acyl carrier protein